jgi:hypothetical protein
MLNCEIVTRWNEMVEKFAVKVLLQMARDTKLRDSEVLMS